MYPLLPLEPVDARWARTAPCTRTRSFDELLAQARQVTDQAKRAELYREAQRLLDDDPPWIFVDHEMQTGGLRQARAGLQAAPELRPPRGDDLAEVAGGAGPAGEPLPPPSPAPAGAGAAGRVGRRVPGPASLAGRSGRDHAGLAGHPGGRRPPARRPRARRAAARCSTCAGWATCVQGDLGRSIRMRQPVLGEVLIRFRATLLLTATALLLSTVGGVALGVLSASRPNSLRGPAEHGRPRSSARACRASGWASC